MSKAKIIAAICAELSFVQTKTNIVFLGPPGVGKTRLSIGLAVKALEVGYSVLFTTLAHLAADLASAPHPVALKARMRRYLAAQVLGIDEVGDTKLREEQANLLFALVRDRYEIGSIILTSNTSFAEWGRYWAMRFSPRPCLIGSCIMPRRSLFRARAIA